MSLSYLKWKKKSLERQWRNAKDLEASYWAKAAEMRAVYDDMKSVKDDMKALKKSVNNYVDDHYSDFWGNNFNDYQKKGEEIVSAYAAAIAQIDINLDRLNDEITKCENLALQNYGLAGNLIGQINYVINQIQNWVN